jgi:hypothetical protein
MWRRVDVVNRRFGGMYRLHLQSAATCTRWIHNRGFFYPEDGGDTYHRNVGSHKIYTAPYPRRQHSSLNYTVRKIIPSQFYNHVFVFTRTIWATFHAVLHNSRNHLILSLLRSVGNRLKCIQYIYL